VAVGSGWQSYVAYINLGCYYCIGVPLGFLMGWGFKLGVMVIFTIFFNYSFYIYIVFFLFSGIMICGFIYLL